MVNILRKMSYSGAIWHFPTEPVKNKKAAFQSLKSGLAVGKAD